MNSSNKTSYILAGNNTTLINLPSLNSTSGFDGLNSIVFDSWFGFSIITSLGGSIILILLLITSFHEQDLHRGARILIIHLMMLQLIIIGVFYPIQSISTYQVMLGQRPFLDCRPLQTLHIGLMYVENWASAFLAINRFVVLMTPYHYARMADSKGLAVMMICPWLVGFGITAPTAFDIGAHFVWLARFGTCVPAISAVNPGYISIWVAIGAYIPMILIGLLYGTMLVRLVKNRQIGRRIHERPSFHLMEPGRVEYGVGKRARESQNRAGRIHERQIALAKMLMVAFLWYSVLFIPSPVISTAFPEVFGSNIMLQLWISKSIVLLGYAASPVIFLILSTDYQEAIHRLFLRVMRIRSDTLNLPLSTTGASGRMEY